MTAPQQVWIELADGTRLAASLYLPPDAAGPQPCILEALPYRKDDLTASYRPEYQRLADEHDFAVCRLDLRGTGSSGGIATDEYPLQEQQDLVEVIGWLGAQPWCDGNVGMYGTSYSGFNALQVAGERPAALKAVIAIYATDDRYTDDVHYMGGTLRWLDLVDYCHYMTPMNALPPVPAVWGDGWREEWLRRVDALEPWLLTWLEQQRDGAYWRHGSVRPAYERIGCPVMLVAGWADGYRNNSLRTMVALGEAGVPRRLLAGTWSHAATDTSLPGPRIDLLPEMVRWWDRWLRGRTDLPEEPVVTYFMRRSTRPEPDLDSWAGEWRQEDWPSPRVGTRSLGLIGRRPYVVRPDVGTAAWISCAGHLPYGQPLDQRFDDAASLTWEWDADDVELLGHALLRLTVTASEPVGFVSAKLTDVFPDGTSALVTRGLLNLTHRNGHESPQPLQPGQPYDVEVELEATAFAFARGHRLRLSLAGADWPNTVAPPRPLVLEVRGGELLLPVVEEPSPYPPPRLVAAEGEPEAAEGVSWRVERDVLARETACLVDHGSGYETVHGTAAEHYRGRVSVDSRTFEQRAESDVSFTLTWPEATVSTRSTLEVRAGAEHFDVAVVLQVREGDDLVAERRWHRRIARDLA